MERIRGARELGRKLRRPVLTIGNFDGLHLGHQTIMDTVIRRARNLGGEAVVYTFEPHPRVVLTPESAPQMLMTLPQKLERLEAMGVDVVIVEPFDAAFAETEPSAFVEHFVHELVQPKEVYVGYDFHYGRDREGSMRMLTETGPRLGFSVTILPEVTVGGEDVNSTRIRDLLKRGEVEQAETLLGRSFAVRGDVVEGDKRGRELGFPTANLASGNEVVPAAGVYSGSLRLLGVGQAPGVRLPSVANVGVRPTFADGRGLVTEVHVLDFDGDLYGQSVEFEFHERLRAEQKFDGVEALRLQIGRDLDEARRRLGRT